MPDSLTTCGWVSSMPFASINPTNPRTHPAQFRKKLLRIDRLAKWGFFESAILNFFFSTKKFFFCFIPWKVVKASWIARMGRNFDYYSGFQPFRTWANTYAQDCTGKSFSEALILASTNPQYEKRLFIDLPVQYIHENYELRNVVYTNCFCFSFEIHNNLCTQHVLRLQFSCTELVIQWTIFSHIVG